MIVPLLSRESRWECPACDFTDVTHEANPHTRYHSCRGMRGLSVPMVPAGTKAKHVAREREDYIAGERVQLDAAGRPVMSVTTVRDDGEDCTVFAPVASISSAVPA